MLENFISIFPITFQSLVVNVLFILLLLAPFFVLAILAYIAWNFWWQQKRFGFIVKQNRILLEIKIPKEIKKTPLAMELFIGAIHQTGGEGTWYDRNIKGKSRTWFSLELVSIEGEVHFFIWTEKRFKTLLESQMYAQYPDVEIYEVPDYTKSIGLDLNNAGFWGNEFIPTNKIDAIPIKTYVDYGLDKVGFKSEEIVDPMTPMIEFLGSLEKGEQIWIQIMVRAHKGGKTGWEGKDWSKVGSEKKKEILESLNPEEGISRVATKGEQDLINAIERNTSKPGFDCGIRGIYITDKDKFNPINITGMTGVFKQYNSSALNGFRPTRVPGFDYPWQDYKNYRVNKIKTGLFDDYKRRNYFYWPEKSDNQFVLSSEELATIFHIPSGVAATPTFSRIPSKKAEPPQNLPF